MAVKILALAGSIRKQSWNKKLLKIAVESAREAGAEVNVVDLKEYPLPVYDGDLEDEKGLPENVIKLRELFLSHQALLIASPEYNSSISGALKNLIDWISRPVEGAPPLDCFTGKVAGLVSTSTGSLGGIRGIAHVRAILENIGVIVIPATVSVPKAEEAFDENGQLKNQNLQKSVKKVSAALVNVTSRFI